MARGGKRPGAGRKPGSSTKINAQQRRTLTEMARDHTEQAVAVLTSIMTKEFGVLDSKAKLTARDRTAKLTSGPQPHLAPAGRRHVLRLDEQPRRESA